MLKHLSDEFDLRESDRADHLNATKHGVRTIAVFVAAGLLAACGSAPLSSAPPGAPATAASSPANAASVPATASSAPAGLPADWSAKSIQAANASLEKCAQINNLATLGCPQQAPGGSTIAVHWTLLNGGLLDPVASGILGGVHVYGRFQMEVSYTSPGIRPYLAYSGGITEATMTWDGQSFQNVGFTDLDTIPSYENVTLPVFARPDVATDALALDAVKAGFHDCVALPPSLAGSPNIPNCPQSTAYVSLTGVTSAKWILTSDPMQGAIVSFDTDHGDLAVTGSYGMNLNYKVSVPGDPYAGANGPHTDASTGSYTATLVWDGQQLRLLNIVTS